METGIYLRVSSRTQDLRGQEAELQRWCKTLETPARWYRDTASGKSMDRPAWQELWAGVESGEIGTVVVWRLDRLGRTAKGLVGLFDELRQRKVGLVSLKDGFDLETPAGRLMANVLASVAAYETEVRSERQRAGIEAARAAGKTWGGRRKGTRVRLTEAKVAAIKAMHAAGRSVVDIAKAVELSRPTIYAALRGQP
ncbi:MAG: recombinase family protein [Pirellulales bacterium]